MAACLCFVHEIRNAPPPLLPNEVWILAAEKVSAVERNQTEERRFIVVVTQTCDLLNSLFVSHEKALKRQQPGDYFRSVLDGRTSARCLQAQCIDREAGASFLLHLRAFVVLAGNLKIDL
jgi:hypothetical protein